MKTALIYHPIYLKHDTGPHHPERISRLQSILRKLKKTGLIDKVRLIEPRAASIEEIALVHSKDYVLGIKDACSRLAFSNLAETPHPFPPLRTGEDRVRGNIFLDPDTVVSKDSFEAGLFAAGAVIEAIELVSDKGFDNAFCMVRPPGHHARPSQAMGFCMFNNIAIGARYIQKNFKINKILIVDWDVHHGNGTEEVFYKDDTVFYISLHQYPHYPGTGSKECTGEGKGKGYNLNIPMREGSGDAEYIKAFKEIIIPRLEDFKPEFILISAGFDGHRDDPLSSLNLTEHGYREMTNILKEAAGLYSGNRIVSVLEGGYNLFALANSVHSHLDSMCRF